MDLVVSSVEDTVYVASASSLPLIYRVRFDQTVVIFGEPRATACVLTREGAEEASAGYVRSIDSFRPGKERVIEAGAEIELEVDAFEFDTEAALAPGMYEVAAKVLVKVRADDGSVKHQELWATRQLSLS